MLHIKWFLVISDTKEQLLIITNTTSISKPSLATINNIMAKLDSQDPLLVLQGDFA